MTLYDEDIYIFFIQDVTEIKLLYDIILLDIQMPLMDGYTAARTIKAHEKEHYLSPLQPMPRILTERQVLKPAAICMESNRYRNIERVYEDSYCSPKVTFPHGESPEEHSPY